MVVMHNFTCSTFVNVIDGAMHNLTCLMFVNVHFIALK